MHVGHRHFCACIGMVVGLLGTQSALACEDLAVLSRDARFLVLSGDTLEEKDVGNLWWLGIRGVDLVIPGSTLERAGVLSDQRVDPATGTRLGPESALALIRDLGRSQVSPGETPIVVDSSITKAWWIDDSPSSRLIGVRHANQKYTIAVYGSDLDQQAEWSATPPGLGLGVACVDGQRTIIGGLRTRLIAADNRLIATERIGQSSSDGYRLLGAAPIGCIGLMGDFVEQPAEGDVNSSQIKLRTIDLATNRLGAEFRAKRVAQSILFARGTRLLQQDLFATPADGGGYRVTPTGRLRVLETQNGSVIRSGELRSAGETSRLLCRGESERVLITGPYELHLIDLTTLSIVASRSIPFESYFAF